MRELNLRALDALEDVLEFLDVDDHRNHDGDFAIDAGAQDGLELRQEEVVALEADADGAIAEERVVLFRNVEVRQRLVTADVHRADDAELALAFLDGFFVGLELVVLGRDFLAAHEDEFGAEQADALSAVVHGVVDIHVRADVRHELDADAVRRDGRQLFELGIVARELFLRLELVVVGSDFVGRRINGDFAALAVDDDVVAVGNLVDAVFLVEADNGRDGARFRDDDGMGRRGARAEEDACNLLGRHASNDGRLDFAAAEDDFLVADFRLFDAEDVFRNALADVTQVDGAGSEVFVFHLLEHLRLLFGRLEHGLRRVLDFVNLRVDVLRHHRVLHHHAVCFEDGGLLLRLVVLLHLLDAFAQLLGDGRQCCHRLLLLGCDVLGLVAHEVAVEVLAREHDFAHRDTGNDAFATNFLCHCSFPQKFFECSPKTRFR